MELRGPSPLGGVVARSAVEVRRVVNCEIAVVGWAGPVVRHTRQKLLAEVAIYNERVLTSYSWRRGAAPGPPFSGIPVETCFSGVRTRKEKCGLEEGWARLCSRQ